MANSKAKKVSKVKRKISKTKQSKQKSRKRNPDKIQYYATQGGGIAYWDDLQKSYVFKIPPRTRPDLFFVPEQWSIIPIEYHE